MAAMSWQFLKRWLNLQVQKFSISHCLSQFLVNGFSVPFGYYNFWLLRASSSGLFFPLTHWRAPILPLSLLVRNLSHTTLLLYLAQSLFSPIDLFFAFIDYFLLDSSQWPTMKCPCVYKTGYFNLLHQNTDMISR